MLESKVVRHSMGFAHTYTNIHRNKIISVFDTNFPIEKCS